jgi:hypothetical protein
MIKRKAPVLVAMMGAALAMVGTVLDSCVGGLAHNKARRSVRGGRVPQPLSTP